MNKIPFRQLYVKPRLPQAIAPLAELAMNVWSTWEKDATQLFNRISPRLYRKYDHNPIKLLHNVGRKRLDELAADSGFLYEMNDVYNRFKAYMSFEGHYSTANTSNHNFKADHTIAYLSMEFGLHESIPVYSGGLGILSGDHLKSASDLGLPMVGFGLLYRYGYFKQIINLEGMQEETYEENDWDSKPITRLRDELGNPLQLSVNIKGQPIYFEVCRVDVGKVPLYLIDTNISANNQYNRQITDYLYVSDRNYRIMQEIILAFGSETLIKHLGIKARTYHLNEGHSAFIIIKRLKDLINERGLSFSQARELIRATTVFTTHTPVPAGNEQFPLDLIRNYMDDKIKACGFTVDEFAAWGKVEGKDNFWLPALAIRFSNYINGVSELHSQVSREMWHDIYPDVFEDELPIKAITNGVHIHSWLSYQLTRLFDRYIGPDYLHMAEERSVWANVYSIPDSEIWAAHQVRKEQFINFVRTRIDEALVYKGAKYPLHKKVSSILNSDYLTIGFARRFAPYKRSHLVLNDKDRLLRILNNPRRPVQFVFAGKAHPADEKGKQIIKEILDFASENDVEDRFVFVENYDINVARHLVQGCDIWLNNPIRPLEASGTSGMKAGMNGVINLSVLDGWWPECYKNSNGWAITARDDIIDPDLRDKLEANQIYELLEKEVAPLYYQRDEDGVSPGWIQMMKHSIYDVGQGFNTHRMLRDYINKFYIPSYYLTKKLLADDGKQLKDIIAFEDELKKHWGKVQMRSWQVDAPNEPHHGDVLPVTAYVHLGDAPRDLFEVEVFYLHDVNQYRTQKMELISMDESNVGCFKTQLQLEGSGPQRLNIRLRPKSCQEIDRFCDYAKWFSN